MTPPARDTVHLGPELALAIPPYQSADGAREVTQLVVARYADQTFTFEAHISMDAERFLLVGLDPLGRKALAITWTAQGVTYESQPWVPADLHPENILADILLLYWPKPFVQGWLAAGNAQLHDTRHDRAVISRGAEIIHIHYPANAQAAWNGRAHYEHRAWGYTLDIQSTENR